MRSQSDEDRQWTEKDTDGLNTLGRGLEHSHLQVTSFVQSGTQASRVLRYLNVTLNCKMALPRELLVRSKKGLYPSFICRNGKRWRILRYAMDVILSRYADKNTNLDCIQFCLLHFPFMTYPWLTFAQLFLTKHWLLVPRYKTGSSRHFMLKYLKGLRAWK